jgi:hypothetical protein
MIKYDHGRNHVYNVGWSLTPISVSFPHQPSDSHSLLYYGGSEGITPKFFENIDAHGAVVALEQCSQRRHRDVFGVLIELHVKIQLFGLFPFSRQPLENCDYIIHVVKQPI